MRLGPRNRRRPGIGGGVVVGAAIVIVVLLVVTRSGKQSPPPPPTRVESNLGRIVFGMNRRQVLHLVGKPAEKQGRCWDYSVRPDPRLAARGIVRSVVGVCFFAGRVSDKTYKDYVRRHGKLVLLPPHPPLQFGG